MIAEYGLEEVRGLIHYYYDCEYLDTERYNDIVSQDSFLRLADNKELNRLSYKLFDLEICNTCHARG